MTAMKAKIEALSADSPGASPPQVRSIRDAPNGPSHTLRIILESIY